MKLKFSIVVLVLFRSCRSYKPFESRKEFKNYNNLIQMNFNLNRDYDKKVIFEISESIKDSVEYSAIQKRINLLNGGDYDELKFIAFMRVDRLLKKYGFEITENSVPGLEFKEINSIEELETHLKLLDSLFSSNLQIKVEKKGKP